MSTIGRCTKEKTEMKTIGVKATLEWVNWLERFARSERISISALIDRISAEAAERRQFQAPPNRLP